MEHTQRKFSLGTSGTGKTNSREKIIIPKGFIALITVIGVLGIQFVIYLLFFHAPVIRWGATDYEVAMQMPGDKYSKIRGSTRAIDIHKPSDEVWSYLADLGADRRGFYSYTFLEYLYGCEIAKQMDTTKRELYVGRLIPYTMPDSAGKYTEGFSVIEATQGKSFVLQGWGGFLIQKVDQNNTRLIVRTLGFTSDNLIGRAGNSIFDMAHHIMEKRMMLGIKDIAENNGNGYTHTKDWIWFLCVFISGLAGIWLIVVCKGYYKLVLPTIFYTAWQMVVLLLHPKPTYAIVLVLLVGALFILHRAFLKNRVSGLDGKK
jgi:hypothetical protein